MPNVKPVVLSVAILFGIAIPLFFNCANQSNPQEPVYFNNDLTGAWIEDSCYQSITIRNVSTNTGSAFAEDSAQIICLLSKEKIVLYDREFGCQDTMDRTIEWLSQSRFRFANGEGGMDTMRFSLGNNSLTIEKEYQQGDSLALLIRQLFHRYNGIVPPAWSEAQCPANFNPDPFTQEDNSVEKKLAGYWMLDSVCGPTDGGATITTIAEFNSPESSMEIIGFIPDYLNYSSLRRWPDCTERHDGPFVLTDTILTIDTKSIRFSVNKDRLMLEGTWLQQKNEIPVRKYYRRYPDALPPSNWPSRDCGELDHPSKGSVLLLGRAIDTAGKPMPDQQFQVCAGQDCIVPAAISDSNGFFRFWLQPGTYPLVPALQPLILQSDFVVEDTIMTIASTADTVTVTRVMYAKDATISGTIIDSIGTQTGFLLRAELQESNSAISQFFTQPARTINQACEFSLRVSKHFSRYRIESNNGSSGSSTFALVPSQIENVAPGTTGIVFKIVRVQ
jgi:hypothetical protein